MDSDISFSDLEIMNVEADITFSEQDFWVPDPHVLDRRFCAHLLAPCADDDVIAPPSGGR